MSPTEPAPVRKSIPQVDFDLDDLDADEERYLDFYRKVGVHEDMLVPLAEHHDGPHSYYVLCTSLCGVNRWQKSHNTSHKQIRARVKHTFARMKCWKLLQDCHLKGDGVHHTMLRIPRLHNLALAGQGYCPHRSDRAPTAPEIVYGTARKVYVATRTDPPKGALQALPER